MYGQRQTAVNTYQYVNDKLSDDFQNDINLTYSDRRKDLIIATAKTYAIHQDKEFLRQQLEELGYRNGLLLQQLLNTIASTYEECLNNNKVFEEEVPSKVHNDLLNNKDSLLNDDRKPHPYGKPLPMPKEIENMTSLVRGNDGRQMTVGQHHEHADQTIRAVDNVIVNYPNNGFNNQQQQNLMVKRDNYIDAHKDFVDLHQVVDRLHNNGYSNIPLETMAKVINILKNKGLDIEFGSLIKSIRHSGLVNHNVTDAAEHYHAKKETIHASINRLIGGFSNGNNQIQIQIQTQTQTYTTNANNRIIMYPMIQPLQPGQQYNNNINDNDEDDNYKSTFLGLGSSNSND